MGVIGRWIVAVRKKRGLSQEALSALLSYKNKRNSMISSWENGWQIPHADTLLEIAIALDCSADDFAMLLLAARKNPAGLAGRKREKKKKREAIAYG